MEDARGKPHDRRASHAEACAIANVRLRHTVPVCPLLPDLVTGRPLPGVLQCRVRCARSKPPSRRGAVFVQDEREESAFKIAKRLGASWPSQLWSGPRSSTCWHRCRRPAPNDDETRMQLPPFNPWMWSVGAGEVAGACVAGARMLEALQASRLRSLVGAARRNSPLFRRLLSGIDPSKVRLQELPVTRKPELMGRFDEWVTDPQVRLDGLRHFTADSRRIGESYLGRYTVWQSSGSTGGVRNLRAGQLRHGGVRRAGGTAPAVVRQALAGPLVPGGAHRLRRGHGGGILRASSRCGGCGGSVRPLPST